MTGNCYLADGPILKNSNRIGVLKNRVVLIYGLSENWPSQYKPVVGHLANKIL